MIVEIARFALESWANLIFVIGMLFYILFLCVGTAGAFKPVTYSTYITQSKAKETNDNEPHL